MDFPVDQHPASICSARPLELPGDFVAFPSKLRPFRRLGRVLLQPEAAFLVGERPQPGAPKPVGPGFYLRQFRHFLISPVSVATLQSPTCSTLPESATASGSIPGVTSD